MSSAYVAIMLGAVATGVVVRRFAAPPSPLPRSQQWALIAGAIIGGTIAAKIPWLVMDPAGLMNGTVWINDGRTLTFGLIGGYLGVEVTKLSLGVRTKTGDSFAVPLAATIAVGRLGCFVAGCCYGVPTSLPWAVRFDDGIPRHPTQLYELIFHAASAVVLYQLAKREQFTRQRVKLYMIAYFVYRFMTEFIRPEPRLAGGLTLYQLASLGAIALFAVLWRLDAKPDVERGQRSCDDA